ncbi:MAG: hypothetical protein DME08_17515 [Candidatus Rokuibacteriota bacterium]|nr:MAG: hypothetical protein DME08_17515 [Candidatus Rokubacteria bacterium]
MTYLDTSALVKRFVAEAGSSKVQSLLTGRAPIASATIAYAELYSGLTRRHREGVLSQLQYRLACRNVERDWMALVKVRLLRAAAGERLATVNPEAARGR